MSIKSWQVTHKRKMKKSLTIKLSFAVIAIVCVAATLWLFKERYSYDNTSFSSNLTTRIYSESRENLKESSLQTPEEYDRDVKDKQEKVKEVSIKHFLN